MRSMIMLATVLLAVGCAGGAERLASGPGEYPEGMLASSVEVGIAAGEVRLSLHLTNTSPAPVRFTFPTSQRYDFEVRDASGTALWRWSADRAFAQVVTTVDLEPGESWDMTASWDPAGRSGLHEAVGRVAAREGVVEQKASFELP